MLKRTIIGVILSALAFHFIFPMLDGIHVTGGFVTALCLGALFTALSWGAARLKAFVEASFIVGTLGLGCLIVIPLNLAFFWVMPALALKGLSLIVPGYFAISGWLPAILGGLVLLFINFLTHSELAAVKQTSPSFTAKPRTLGPRKR